MYFTRFGAADMDALSNSYGDAQSWLLLTIDDLERNGTLPRWRSEAMRVHVENMPRAGFTFDAPGIGLVGVVKR